MALILIIFYELHNKYYLQNLIHFLNSYLFGSYFPDDTAEFSAYKAAWYFSIFLTVFNLVLLSLFMKNTYIEEEDYLLYQQNLLKQFKVPRYRTIFLLIFYMTMLFGMQSVLPFLYYFSDDNPSTASRIFSSRFYNNFNTSSFLLLVVQLINKEIIIVIIMGFKLLFYNKSDVKNRRAS